MKYCETWKKIIISAFCIIPFFITGRGARLFTMDETLCSNYIIIVLFPLSPYFLELFKFYPSYFLVHFLYVLHKKYKYLPVTFIVYLCFDWFHITIIWIPIQRLLRGYTCTQIYSVYSNCRVRPKISSFTFCVPDRRLSFSTLPPSVDNNIWLDLSYMFLTRC